MKRDCIRMRRERISIPNMGGPPVYDETFYCTYLENLDDVHRADAEFRMQQTGLVGSGLGTFCAFRDHSKCPFYKAPPPPLQYDSRLYKKPAKKGKGGR